jgi:hypothetical protein
LFARQVRWLAILTFAIFAIVSFRSAREGWASCGCFGELRLNPWLVFGLDICVVGVLLLSHPTADVSRLAMRRVARVGAIAAVLLAIALAVPAAYFGSLAGAVAHLRGDEVTVTPSLVDLGSQSAGTVAGTEILVTNHTKRPLRVSGGTSDCQCVATDDLPLALAPGASGSVGVKLKLPGSVSGRFVRRAWLWTDADERQVEFRLTGYIAGAGSQSTVADSKPPEK